MKFEISGTIVNTAKEYDLTASELLGVLEDMIHHVNWYVEEVEE